MTQTTATHDNQGRSLESLRRLGERQRADADRREEYHETLSAALDRHQGMDPKWETLEGVDVLRVPGDDLAAFPITGRKNARVFQVFTVSSREPGCQLKKAEVYGWLSKNSEARRRFDEDLAAALRRGNR